MAKTLSDTDFTLTFRGYDKDEVDARIHSLLSELSLLRQTSKHATADADSLRNEVANLRRKLKNSTNLGYADLGSQFEQTLRLAEEQAKKLINDAGQEAIKIRDTAKAESDAAIRKSESLANKLVAEAEQRVIELKLQASTLENSIASKTSHAEQQATDLVLKARQEANQILAAAKAESTKVKTDVLSELDGIRDEINSNRATAQELLVSAQTKASDLVAKANAQIQEERQAAVLELENIASQTALKQSELDGLIRQIQQERMTADMDIAEKRHQSEREASEMYQRTLAQSDDIMARAEALLSDAAARAKEITLQAENTLKQAEIQAENLSETSNRNAFHLINEARRRSELLTRKAEGYALNAITDAEERARRLQDEYEDINEFLDSLKSLMSTEAVVSVVESTALALSAEESKRESRAASRKTRSDFDEANTVDAELMEEDEQ